MAEIKSRWRPFAAAVAICAVVYGPRLGAPLIWDDHGTIVLNRAFDNPIPLGKFFAREYFSFSGEHSWRPAATLSYYAMIRVFGRSPTAMRGIHLLLHLANGLLLAALLLACGLSAGISGWAAALFLVHPAHTETLLCASFNEEILCAFGLLVMILGHARKQSWLAASGFAFALLSKETGILGLPLVLMYDLLRERTPFRFFRRRGNSFSSRQEPELPPTPPPPQGEGLSPRVRRETWGRSIQRYRMYATYGLASALYLWIYFSPLGAPGGQGNALPLPFSERLYYALSSVALAARVFFLPLRLRIEYYALPASSTLDWLLSAGAAVLIVGCWGWLIHRYRKRDRALTFLLLWPIPFLILTSNLFPVALLNLRLFAERWMYLPYLGSAAALAYFLHRRPRWGAALLLFWGACGWARAFDWSAEPRLWNGLVRFYPWCAKAQEGLAEAYAHRGMYPEALAAYQQALALRETRQDKILAHYAPLSRDNFIRWESPTLHRGLGRTYLKLGRLDAAEKNFLKASALDPGDGYTYDIMTYRFAETGNFRKAQEWLERGLRARPDDTFLLRIKPDVIRRKLTFKAGFH